MTGVYPPEGGQDPMPAIVRRLCQVLDRLQNECDTVQGLVDDTWDEIARLREALEAVTQGEQCENFTGPPWCRDPRSGRTRDAEYGADAWCQTCIARAALEVES